MRYTARLDVLEGAGDSAHGLFSPTDESCAGEIRRIAGKTDQRVIAAEGERQNTVLCMVADDLCNGLANAGYEAGVLELADGRVVLSCDLFELVVALELDLPAKFGELLG